jgi:cytochrome c oxidase subunit 3
MEKSLTGEMKIIEEPRKPLAMHPKKFAMWLFMASVMMLFASLTSAYIVREAEGNWIYFDLPVLFYYTTVIIIFSSVTMQWAYFEAKKDNADRVKSLLVLTSLLGMAFLAGQFLAWGDLVRSSVYFVGNPSGSFLYVLTGLHGLHIVSAVVFLLVVLYAAVKRSVHSKNMAQMEMCTTYWHFLGALWIYLFIFFLINR